MSRWWYTHALITVLCWMCYTINIEGACPVGHYCPPEGGQIACPKGFYNPTPDSTDHTACLACPGGKYCGTAGLSAPQGDCGAGWYCPGPNIVPQPIGKECWPNHYCPGGDAAPIMCAPGHYQPAIMQASCLSCPAGSYCLDGIIMGICYDGYYCNSGSSSPTQNECTPGHYCTGGVQTLCPKGMWQDRGRQNDCHPCPYGKYCATTGLTTFTGKCATGFGCELGSTTLKSTAQRCPKGHRCNKGYLYKCGVGYYQPLTKQQACLICPVGSYCPSETTINPTPCAQGECCVTGFYESKPCHQGEFLHLTYDASSRPTWDEANALCQAQGWYKPAVIDAQAEYDRMITWFLETSPYASNGNLALPAGVWLGGNWTGGAYYWDMTFQVSPMTWGNWQAGENPTPTTRYCLMMNTNLQFQNAPCGSKMDILCEKSSPCLSRQRYNTNVGQCVVCPKNKYCKEPGLFTYSGFCDDGWYCNENSLTRTAQMCFAGKYCTGGYWGRCERGTYQSFSGQAACEPCQPGKYCNETQLSFPVGLCDVGFYCPAGSEMPSDTICPVGHYCPIGSGAPTPCPGGQYQDEVGQAFCKMCPEGMYCDTAEAIAEQQSGAGSSTHGVVTPKPCPAHIDCFFGSSLPTSTSEGDESDPYDPGALDLSIICTPFCSGPVSSIQETATFQVSCSTCGSSVPSYTWSVRKCVGQTIDECEKSLRQINYIDNNVAPTYVHDSKWLTFDTTGWTYFAVVVKGILSAEDGMMYKLWWTFNPWTGAVNCATTPTQGQPMDTVFSISCDPVPGEDQLTLDLTLSAYNEVLYQGSSPITNLQLPQANPADTGQLPLHLEASTNGGQFFYETDFTVEINPSVDGGYTTWTSWSVCTLTCASGTQTRTRECTNPAPQYTGANCVGDPVQTQACNTSPCPIDGGYTTWSVWGTCSLTCGTGSRARSRDCTNPAPQYGGANCVGASSGTQACNTQNCPIDGGYTLWTAWDTCTVTCGTGNQARTRDCTNPVPQYGGANCVGASSGTQACNTQNCPIDGGYTLWTAWDTCTVTCGTGNQARTRDCTNPVPQYGGANCVGASSGTQDCNTQNCPIDGGYTLWTAWDTCTVTCGTGSQARTRDCTNPVPQYGGANCVGASSGTQDCNTQNCPIDGGYTLWTAWDTCTVTCGTGSQARTRDCTNPVPQYGGANCVGASSGTQDCNTQNCPIDGGYTLWTAWDTCTVTCGTGSQARTRDCTNPVPQYGGANCVGASSGTQDCNTQNCPIDGGYTLWTAWDTCTVTCGTGNQARTRDCTNPVPQYGGANCVGASSGTQDCNTQNCPINGGYTLWTAWDTCTVTCGTGSQARTRDCTNPVPQYGGANCVGASSGTQDCNTQNCPIDGGYTLWTAWDTCTVTCGTGSQARTRDCTNPLPQYGGANCVGDSSGTQDCNTQNCPIDGGYTLWTAWDTCTVTCGTGSQARTRDCTNPVPQYRGANCVGDSSGTQACNTHNCPIEGGYTEWTDWGTCSHTCGTGSQTRTRDCTNPAPQYGGASCVGTSTETQDCNTQNCPIDGGYTLWTAWDTCTVTCGTGSQARTRDCTSPVPQYGGANCVGASSGTQACNTHQCPIDGGYTEWTDWGTCSHTCGTGSQTRTRDCTNPAPQYGGASCVGVALETQDCNTNNCPIDGGYMEWTAWGTCSHTCGTGSQARTRDCTNPAPQYGGANCVGLALETQNCNTQHCPIDGGFTMWALWTTCTVTCGGGSRARNRDCTNPVPQYGGADCVGPTTETQDCNTHLCPIDGGYTVWSDWAACTHTCGTGTQTRTRDCTNPSPQNGGADCVGEAIETQDCNTQQCPIDGGFTDWTVWNTCTVTCGTGTQSRTRDCTNPAPQFGGVNCVGITTESQACNTNHCPIDGGYTDWADWGMCSLTCGTGSQTRTRDCTNPAPQYGGADCVGVALETQDCTAASCAVDGGFTEWTIWDTCTVTCGTGAQARTRECTNPAPQMGGADCVGITTESQACNTHNCPIDGGYTEWTVWDTCTVTCGTGSQNRARDCTNPVPQYGGAVCIGPSSATQDCNTHQCPIDGGYTEWTAWNSCTVACGTGSQTRARSCTNPAPQYGGVDCLGEGLESQTCNTHNCPIDGGYTVWTDWDTCTLTCGTGSQTRTRDCTNPTPQYGGANCVGDSTENQACNTQACPIDGGYTEWTVWDSCTLTCGIGSQARTRECTNPEPQFGGANCVGLALETQDCNTHHCPIDGGYTEWTAWGTCSQTCGTGSQARTRHCTNPAPQYGGASCVGLALETQYCNTHNCPIDGGYTEWTVWNTCTVTCGTGSQARTRDCSNPVPQYGGANCLGLATDSQNCNTHNCPIDGGYTEWTDWDTCTLTCGSGSQTRTRDCTNPVPQYGGSDCIGDATANQACNTQACPIDGGYTEWTVWAVCSLSCGTGSQARTRDCSNPAPQFGGADCVGTNTEAQDCNTQNCPIDGGYTVWTLWDACTQTCGTGSQSRSRTCTDPAPEYGGADCVGNPEETQACNTNPCPVDGGWTEWTEWNSCTQTCGTGSQTRSRSCTNPAPAYGGAECLGLNTEALDCNTDPCPVFVPYTAGSRSILFSCVPTCTSLMSSAHAILIDARCLDCDGPVSSYEWTLRQCVSYRVEECQHYAYQIHFVNSDTRSYKYDPADQQYNTEPWTHFGIFVKVTMADGQMGMTHYIWKFFDPVTSPVSCNVAPPSGFSRTTLFNISCENVATPEPYNITYSLYDDPAFLVLLYKGPTSNVTGLLLPTGFEDAQNNLHLHMIARIQGHRFYLSNTVVEVQPQQLVTLMTYIVGNTTDETANSSSVIEQKIQEGDVIGAALTLENIAGLLNHATDVDITTQEIDYSNVLTPTEISMNNSSTVFSERLVEFRTDLVKSVALLEADSYDSISTVSAVLAKVIEKPDDLTEEAREIATETYSNLAESLVEAVGNTEEEIPMEEFTNAAGAILEGAGTMMDLYIDTAEEQLTRNETVDSDTQTTPAPATQNVTKSIQIADDFLRTVDQVCEALIDRQIQGMEAAVVKTDTIQIAVQKLSPTDFTDQDRQIQGMEAVVVKTDTIQIAVQKLSPTDFTGTTIEVESPTDATKVSTVSLPQQLSLPETVTDLRLHTVFLEKNPYVAPHTSSGPQVQTQVVSITLKDQDNNEVDVTGLLEPLKINVPVEYGPIEQQNLTLNIHANKQRGSLTVVSYDNFWSDKTAEFSITDGKVMCLRICVAENLASNFTDYLIYITDDMRRPLMQNILKEGKLYPIQVYAFSENFAGYFGNIENSGVVYLAPDLSMKYEEIHDLMYAKLSLDLRTGDVMELLKFLAPDCAGNEAVETCLGHVETTLEVRTSTLQCMYWNSEAEAWSDEGCWVSTTTTDHRLGCECDHLSVFGGNMMFMSFDEDDLVFAFLNLGISYNPLMISVVLVVWMGYIVLVFWARQADERDHEKEGVVRCSGSSPTDTHGYLVCVMTGWWKQAGTTANVFMYINGTLDVSPRTCLTFGKRDCLQNGSEDWFLLTLEHSLGHLQSVTLWHDNSGTSPHWYLKRVFVKDLQSGESCMFLCNDWLAADRGLLRKTSVTMVTSTGDELQHRQKYHFFLKTSEDLRDGHIWMSIFSKPAKSYFTRVQRLSCCLTILLTTMLADLMFYGIPTSDSDGSFSLSMSQVVIGLKGSLVVFPLSFCIVQLYLRTKPKPQTEVHCSAPIQLPDCLKPPSRETIGARNMDWLDDMFRVYTESQDFPVLNSHKTQWDLTLPKHFMSHFNLFPNTWVEGEAGEIGAEKFYRDCYSSEGSTENGCVDKETCERARLWAEASTSEELVVNAIDRGRILPWWCLYIAWSVVMMVCIACSFLVMLYGGSYGQNHSVEWLVAVSVGVLLSVLIQEPVKVVAMSILLTFILKKSVQLVQPILEQDIDETFEKGIAIHQPPIRQNFMQPLSASLLHKIKAGLGFKWLWTITIKDIVLQAIYLTLILVVINSQRPFNLAYLSTATVKNLFVNNKAWMPLHKVKTPTNFYAYLHGTLIPGMAEVTAESRDEVTLGSNHYLIGPYRLRQLRVRNGTCISVIKSMIPDGCDMGYEGSVQDTEHHSPGWGPAPATIDSNSPWRHRKPEELETMWLYGNHANYPGSGYVVDMAQDTGLHHDVLNSLETDGWIDERTRAVFVEFTLYNPGVDLFNVVILAFECTNLGRIFPDYRIYTTSLPRYLDSSQIVVLVCEILYTILNIKFMCIQFMKYRTKGRRKYFADYWNIAELAQISISFAIVGLFVYRYMIVEWFLDKFQRGETGQFIDMSPIVHSDLYINYATAGLLGILMIKVMKLLQFHWRPRIIAKTLWHVKSHLFHFMLLTFFVIVAYSHSAYLMFHNVLYSYRAIGHTLLANFSIILGMADFADASENSWILGPLYLITFIVSVNFCLVTMYAVILNISRIEVKDSSRKRRDRLTETRSRLKDIMS